MGAISKWSFLELFHIGIGPSSSHTVGPMKAAKDFMEKHLQQAKIKKLSFITVELFGSLALTGKGHGTDKAILLGLSMEDPETINPNAIETILEHIKTSKKIELPSCGISFNDEIQFNFNRQLKHHPNGVKFTSYSTDSRGAKKILLEQVYFSVGGGTILTEEEIKKLNGRKGPPEGIKIPPYPFLTGDELLRMCRETKKKISEVMMENELFYHSREEVTTAIEKRYRVMQECINRGMNQEGQLPGPLKVKKRAKDLKRRLVDALQNQRGENLRTLDWVNLFAISVNEENASGSKVVTAPTNGASGIIPATLRYYMEFCDGQPGDEETFILTATAIGLLYKMNASISGAEVGCQGEVGVASSMAAGALCELLGGTPLQVENAAEIAMEHHLGLTCDPIAGLVQIPCIERNAMGAVKAINAARMSLMGDGEHVVSLDKVIKTMKKTGDDMLNSYKETSKGGLAIHVNVTEC